MDHDGTLFVDLINRPLSRLSDSDGMSPWEVIEEALAQKRPPRGQAWLAEQLGEKIQVVNNWKQRGRVPPARYREIGRVLGLTVDQLEGLSPLPWERREAGKDRPQANLLPEVTELAEQINGLSDAQREWVLQNVRSAIDLARKTIVVTQERVISNSRIDTGQPGPSSKRASR